MASRNRGNRKAKGLAAPANPVGEGSVTETYIQDNQQDYFNSLTDRAGLGTGTGVQPFHEWVKNNGYAMAQRGYSNALTANPTMKFNDYMANSWGTPNAPQAEAGATPVNTGNAYTSSSGATISNFKDYVRDQGLNGGMGGNKRDNLKKKYAKAAGEANEMEAMPAPGSIGVGAAANVGDYSQMINFLRNQFRRLTPEQAGTYQAGYSPGPSRWSVFG